MKFFNKKNTQNKETTKLPMSGKVKKGFRNYCVAVLAVTMVLGTSVTAFAANDPITVVNNLSDFIFGLIRAVGMILLGFGIVQIGLSLKSHDPSQKRLFDPCRRRHHYLCKRDFDSYHRLISDNKKTQDRAYGADPLCGLLRKAILRTEVV